MSRLELISPEGLRVDGRRSHELRRFFSKTGILTTADGSAYVEMGNTQVIVAVYGPREPSKRHDSSLINVEFQTTSLQSKKLRRDRRLLEMASLIKESLESIVMHASRSEIDVFIQIVQQDGGLLHAGLNAACLGLVDAGIPISDYLVACSAGYCNEVAVMDLNYIEESAEMPLLTLCIAPKSERVILLNVSNVN